MRSRQVSASVNSYSFNDNNRSLVNKGERFNKKTLIAGGEEGV